jgi:PadR family transcriptional regulator PadR
MEPAERFPGIRKGLLEFLTLKVISAKPVYAADILATLAGTSFATQEGTLYPLLSKLRRDELVDYEWRESEAGPPRKYYSLTLKGKEELAAVQTYWKDITKEIASL